MAEKLQYLTTRPPEARETASAAEVLSVSKPDAGETASPAPAAPESSGVRMLVPRDTSEAPAAPSGNKPVVGPVRLLVPVEAGEESSSAQDLVGTEADQGAGGIAPSPEVAPGPPLPPVPATEVVPPLEGTGVSVQSVEAEGGSGISGFLLAAALLLLALAGGVLLMKARGGKAGKKARGPGLGAAGMRKLVSESQKPPAEVPVVRERSEPRPIRQGPAPGASRSPAKEEPAPPAKEEPAPPAKEEPAPPAKEQPSPSAAGDMSVVPEPEDESSGETRRPFAVKVPPKPKRRF